MKYMFLILAAFVFTWHPGKSEKEKHEEARERCYAEHCKIAEKIMKREVWWIQRPGVITENQDGTGELINFCTAPSAENDFYKPGLFTGLRKMFEVSADTCPDLVGRAKQEWPIQPEVRFERFETNTGGKRFLVCNGLLWMRFVDSNSSP